MGIVNEQLIVATEDNNFETEDGSAKQFSGKYRPFSAARTRENAPLGWGGFSYAPSSQLQTLFGSTNVDDFLGPFGADLFNKGVSTYGTPGNFNKMADTEKSILGQLSEALKGNKDSSDFNWRSGVGLKMGYSFTTGPQWRSMSQREGWANSSGSVFSRFDSENQYRVTTWYTPESAEETVQQHKEWRNISKDEYDERTDGDPDKFQVQMNMDGSEILNWQQAEWIEEVTTTIIPEKFEVYPGKGGRVKTGLRNLPATGIGAADQRQQ